MSSAKLYLQTLWLRPHALLRGTSQRAFGISRPRIVVAGLNPHAGEQGALGEEDGEIVAPAVKQLQAEGIDAIGPLPADTLFHERARATYDVALCMYHDQALIPIQDAGFRPRGECDAGTAICANLA